jgi:copper/silver efflux system protein
MVIYLHEALDRHIARGNINHEDIEQATIEGAVQRLRPKLMTVAVVMLRLAPILWESGISSDVMKPIAAPREHKASAAASYRAAHRSAW